MIDDYNIQVQTLFLRMMVTNAELYTRVMNILNVEHFDKRLRPAAEFIVDHCKKYSVMPEPIQIKATTDTDIETLTDLDDGHYEWFLHEFENFTKRQALEKAILKSADLLEKGDYTPVEKLIKDAVQISLQRDMGTDYFADPRGRLMHLKSNNGQISTGWPSVDHKLYGGMNRGELNIFAAGSGVGKSLFLQNLAVNWVLNNLNGVYLTLELAEDLCSKRIDSMVTDISQQDIYRDLDNVEMKVKMISKKAGTLIIKYLPAQSNINDIRAYIKELQIQKNIKIDFLCVDYLDLLMPVSAKVSPSDLFIKDKYVSEELRNLAKELSVLLVTASQLNRTAVDEIEFDHSHIAGGISKINTADNVFGIFTSRSLKEQGKYQIQLMKTRSSSGVGQKIELAFDVNTLRITDPDPESNNRYKPQPSGTEILSQIKNTSKIGSVNDTLQGSIEPENKRIDASADGQKLRALLNSLQK
jgi:archaellum biogenesis ATPase FlaH